MLLDELYNFLNFLNNNCKLDSNQSNLELNIEKELLSNFSCPIEPNLELEQPIELLEEQSEELQEELQLPFSPDDLINELDKYNYILFKWNNEIQIKNLPNTNQEFNAKDILLEFKIENKEYKKLILSRNIKIKEINENQILAKNIKGTLIQKEIINKTKDLQNYLNQYKELKDKQFFLRFEIIHINVILNFYKKATETYNLFFNNFKSIFETIENLETTIDSKIKQINEIDKNIENQNYFSSDVSNAIKNRNQLVDELNDLVSQLNTLLGNLETLRNVSPYFAISDSIKKAYLNFSKLTENQQDLSKIKDELKKKETEYTAPQTGAAKENISSFETQINNLKQKLIVYSNNFIINQKNINDPFTNNSQVDRITLNYFSIGKNNIALNGNNIQITINYSPYINWSGLFYSKYNSFINQLLSQDNSNIDLEELNNTVYLDMDNLSNELSNLILINAQDYAYVILNKENVYVNLVTTPNEELNQKYNEFNNLLNSKKNELKEVEDKLKFIKDTINEIQNISLEFNDNIVSETEMVIDGNKETVGIVILNYNTEEDNFDENENNNVNINFNGLSTKPGFTSDKWWKRFNNLATDFNLNPMYYAVGFIAGGTPILMPIIWRHIKVITLPIGILEIGLGMCGVAIAPYIVFFNFSNASILGTPKNGAKFLVAMKPNVLISARVETKIAPTPKLAFMIFKYEKDANVTKQKLFIKDDLPAMERLGLNNPLFLLFLNKWCLAGKLSQGL